MVAIVHQTFGNVQFTDACVLMQCAAFQYHLMAHEALCSTIDDAVGILQLGCQIVGIQNGYLRGTRQALCSHHADIAIGDGQDTCTAEWRSRYLIGGIAKEGMTRQEGH